MTITDVAPTRKRSAAADRAPMTSLRKTALVAGAFYLLTFVSIPTLVLYHGVHQADFILGTGSASPVLLGGVLELIVGLAGIGTAVALYPVVKRQNEGFAMGFVASRTLEAAGLFIAAACLLTVVSLRQSGAGADAMVTSQALVAMYDKVFLVSGSLIPAVNGVLLGTLLYRSRLVPRALPLLGFVGATLLTVSFLATMFGVVDRVSPLTGLFAAPIAVWGVLARRLPGGQGLPALTGDRGHRERHQACRSRQRLIARPNRDPRRRPDGSPTWISESHSTLTIPCTGRSPELARHQQPSSSPACAACP